MKRIVTGLLLNFIAEPAMAAEAWQTESMLPVGLKMLGGLVFVLGLVLLLYYL